MAGKSGATVERKGTGDTREDKWKPVSHLRQDALAILCSDIHLSHKAPIARSAEEDWYQAMLRPIEEMNLLARNLQVPIICAGDIFDKWNSPPELINFAIDNLPKMIAIPGQHDLPLHSYDDIHKSAYWTLVKAGRITHLDKPNRSTWEGLYLHPFAWGQKVTPLEKEDPDLINLAVVHSYIWKKGFGFPGAPAEKRAGNYLNSLVGYDAAVFGDNHQGFQYHQILNCGTFMRRKADEFNYTPQVGILLRNGRIEIYNLSTVHDKFIDMDKALALIEKGLETTDFLEELGKLGKHCVDFAQALKEFCESNHVNSRIRSLLSDILETSEND